MNQDDFRHPSWQCEDDADVPVNPSANPTFYDTVAARLDRRQFLAAGGSAVAGLQLFNFAPKANAATAKSSLTFEELPHGLDENFHVASHYQSQVVIRWGDPIFPNVPPFNPHKQSAADQERRFGYNNDFVGFIPLPFGSRSADHGLLCVNHEYTDCHMMFPGGPKRWELTPEQVAVEMASLGHSVVEIKRVDGRWQPILNSKYNRRLTASSPMQISGPAAGSDRLKTGFSGDGIHSLGTFGNCAGGVTPWGTVLSGEENIQDYFRGNPSKGPERNNHKRFGVSPRENPSRWGKYHARFHLDQEHRAPNHYGWIVEIDPLDPTSTPKKRTALGRFRHEGCTVFINKTGHAVAYTGDDQRFEYVYRFVSKHKFQPNNPRANRDLLDEGTLSVAEFKDDGSVHWHPLVIGTGPLTPKNGFHSQADVVIEARRAGDLLGATPMDRPEDVETNPVTGSVFVMLTNNSARKPDALNSANPRPNSLFGHIVELVPPAKDHTADVYTWDFLLLAGNPNEPKVGAKYHPDVSADGWLIAPDNCAFDNRGRIWIATDGGSKFGVADGVWACDVEGDARALTRHFLRTPRDAELCGPCITPDDKTFFCAVQHPGARSSFDEPNTRWPDFDDAMPPRSAVVAVSHSRGLDLGS